MNKALAGKTAIVTGSGKGIGSALAVGLARQGVHVLVHYCASVESARKTLEDVRACGCDSHLVRADISTPEGARYLFEETRRSFGAPDILVNNAAVQFQKAFADYTPEQVERIFKTNLRGYLLMTQLVVPEMRARQWGRIINISSVHAKRPTMFDPCYSMTKGAIKMLTRESALELAEDHITVNSVELGGVEIGVKSGNPQPIVTEADRALPKLFRFGERGQKCTAMPKDVVPLVSFLAGEDTEKISGSAFRLDGTLLLA